VEESKQNDIKRTTKMGYGNLW